MLLNRKEIQKIVEDFAMNYNRPNRLPKAFQSVANISRRNYARRLRVDCGQLAL